MKATPKEIAERIQRSQDKYEAIKLKQEKAQALVKKKRGEAHEKRQVQRDQVKEGLAWAEGQNIRFQEAGFAIFDITCGYIVSGVKDPLKDMATIRAAYAIKAPHDKPNPETGRGLVAYRLMQDKPDTEMILRFEMPAVMLEMQPAAPMDVISSFIKIRSLTVHKDIPKRVEREIFQSVREAYKAKKKKEAEAKAKQVIEAKKAEKRRKAAEPKQESPTSPQREDK
jgi:hypothetical protein